MTNADFYSPDALVTQTPLLYGGGGHGRVVLDCLRASGRAVIGFFDDDPAATLPGVEAALGAYRADRCLSGFLLLAVGNNEARLQLAARVSHAFTWAVHPSALVSEAARLGVGTVVLARAVVQPGAWLGQHVIVNTGAIVEHDCRVDSFAHVAPGAVLCGGVRVGAGTLVGANATVLPGLRLGRGCQVGAGAVVTHSFPDYTTVVGVPARRVS